MRAGCILIKVLPNFEGSVLTELENMQQCSPKIIKSVDVTLGEYDIIVRIEATSEEEFLETLWTIAAIKGVTNTNTLSIVPKDFVKKHAIFPTST